MLTGGETQVSYAVNNFKVDLIIWAMLSAIIISLISTPTCCFVIRFIHANKRMMSTTVKGNWLISNAVFESD